MKHIILSVLLLCAVAVQAQYACRDGNMYAVNGQSMNKRAFANYMQQNAEQQLAEQFNQALKTANVGWGLFGAGLATQLTGSIVGLVGIANGINAKRSTDNGALIVAGTILNCTGSAATTAGIVCLGVGYARMHKAADIYLYTNGLGLALRF